MSEKDPDTIVVRYYEDKNGRQPFAKFYNRINDMAAVKITSAIIRLRAGNTADSRSVGKGVSELRINLINSGDGKVFINRNNKAEFEFDDDWVFDWKRFYNNVYTIRPEKSWERKTEITFYQDEPQPLNVSFMDIFQDTSNE